MRRNLLFAFLATLGTGCGGGGSNPDAQTGEAAANAQEVGTSSPYCTSKPAVASVTNLSGTWVMRLVGTLQVSALGTKLYPESVFYILTTISQSGTDIVADGRYCDRTEIDAPGALVPVIIPDKWAHTEKPIHRLGSFVPGNVGMAILNFPNLVEIAGAVLASPDTDPLPTDPLDSHVIDEDGDGHPGITVNLSGIAPGSLYSVQRQTTSVVAVAVASDRFEGVLTFGSSQVVLDSNPSSLKGLYAQSISSPDPTPCSSTFAMVKVSGASGLDCGLVDGGAVDAGDVDGGANGATLSCACIREHEAWLFP
jgi:hypothetical protein